jgi:conjugative relaxase-like TrwC/TraI family protein
MVGVTVLRITKLKGAEYLIRSVADGMEDYYMGAGEAPGVWRGRWAAELGLEGVVEADALRALVNGLDPNTGVDLLVGHRERKVRAFDVTLSVPKSASLLWALGTPETASVVSIAVVEATDVALAFLEERAAFARQQQGGVRRRVSTDGFAIATFTHRTSRAGDPQLHVHCLIPNILRRGVGEHVAFDADPLYVWGKATGTVFLNHLEQLLTERLGVAWGPERNGCREMVGFSREQLRVFSKRTVAIETHLEAAGEVVYDSKRARMRADDRASLATRQKKDKTATPEQLRKRWAAEAAAVGLRPGRAVDDLVIGRQLQRLAPPSDREIFAALVDPATGLCATESRFCEAHVVERVAALSGGRLRLDDIVGVSERFLASELVVRLAPDVARRKPPEWSTVELRAIEDRLLARLDHLTDQRVAAIDQAVVEDAITAEPKRLGRDQANALYVLCREGPGVRVLRAPAGHGKTTAVHAAATASRCAGRPVIVVAPTHKAVSELRAAELDAHTVARLCRELRQTALVPDTTVIVDETSQIGTRDAAVVLDAVAATPGAQVWFVGDARQAQSVAAGGLAAELDRLAQRGDIPAAVLEVNRRQRHAAERAALARYRAGDLDASKAIRSDHGWEHELPTPGDTRQALAAAAVKDADRHGAERVAVLAVSHADCEDLADRIRAIRAAQGELRGPSLTGPGWGPDPRVYAAGDRVLVHANLNHAAGRRVHNGSTGIVLTVSTDGLTVALDNGSQVRLDARLVGGFRGDGTPNVSHAWARTVDGAQGGTWRQVHLLGTPALDRFTGYVGQSRGQAPTHTWNTRPEPDHPLSLVADDRSPGEAVLDAMRRAEAKTLAARNDPWTLDRQLRAERDEHAAAVATRSPDPQPHLQRARDTLASATEEHHWALQGLALRENERARLGPLTRLRGGGRDEVASADDALAGARRRLERAEHALGAARADIARLDQAAAARTAWDHAHGWRLNRIDEIDDALAHHWAEVVLRAVRADDPVAFGADRLSAAHATFQNDLRQLTDSLPPDRRDALARARADLRSQEHKRRALNRELAQAPSAVAEAARRRWGRRDRSGIDRARARLDAVRSDLARTVDVVARCRQNVTEERQAVAAWSAAMRATADQRAHLTTALTDIGDALDITRAERVAAATRDPGNELWRTLGPPPASRGGLAAWCGIAERIEAWRDQHPDTRLPDHHAPGADDLADLRLRLHLADRRHGIAGLVERAPAIIDRASQQDLSPPRAPLEDWAIWQQAVDAAHRALAVEQATRSVERGLGIDL